MADQWASTDDHAPSAPPAAGGGWASTDDHAPAQKPRTWLDSVEDYGKGIWNNLADTGQSMVNAVTTRPDKTLGAIGAAQDAVRLKAEDAFKKGNYAEGVRHVLDYLIPIAGPGIDASGDKAQGGQVAEALGEATSTGLQLALPEALKANAPAAAIPPSTGEPSGVASRLYQSSLNPRINTPRAEVASMVRTGLDNGIPVSEAGAQKLSGLLQDLNQQIQNTVKPASQRGVTVDPWSVANRVDAVKQTFKNQVNPTKDLKSIDLSQSEFLNNNPKPIPADDAQSLKVGTYQRLSDQYGKVSEAKIEAQKALARGLKEELTNALPELTELNSKEGRLYDLQPVLEAAVNRAVGRTAKGPGLTSIVTGGAVGAASGSGVMGVGAGIMKHILSDPAVSSRLAIAINKAQQLNPAKYGQPSIAGAVARVNQLAVALDQASKQPQ